MTLEELTNPDFILFTSLILVPAYMANGMGPILGGGRPLDGGKVFIDGRRILGDGKTVNGTLGGILCGTLASLGEIAVVNLFMSQFFSFSLNLLHALFGFVISVGAISGDLTGAFIKRRLNLPRGASAPGLDQLDFVVAALVFAWAFTRLVSVGGEVTWLTVVVVVTITPFIHLLSNYVAFKIGKKNEPW
ncbi:MAG: CDP-2,3-bis-(O-geranylgeranyl)-sn-glycerol synthase [Candidatus Bathyarchaeia archaeon]